MKLLAQRIELTNELASLLGQVRAHCVVTLEVLNSSDPGKRISIEHNVGNFPGVYRSFGENNTFGF